MSIACYMCGVLVGATIFYETLHTVQLNEEVKRKLYIPRFLGSFLDSATKYSYLQICIETYRYLMYLSN